MEQLKTHMAENALTHEVMAKKIGISRVFLTQILNGSRSPGLKVQLKIEDATDGGVPAVMWATSRLAAMKAAAKPQVERMAEIEP